MSPTVFRGPLSAACKPGDPASGSGAGFSASSTAAEMVTGPILAQLFPLSRLRSTHAAHVSYASNEVPLTMVPSGSTSGLARIGPSSPAGSRSGFDHVIPSSSLNIRPADQLPGDGPTL